MPPRHSTPPSGTTDEGLIAPAIELSHLDAYAADTRQWQGIPTIERAKTGRLWASWYTGGAQEDNDNYALLATSDDDGQSWKEPVAVINPKGMTRAWDPCLWHDPQGKLHWSWAQSCPMRGEVWDGRGGIWEAIADNSDDANTSWSQPTRLYHGVALNKPLITRTGLWVQPMAIWWFFEHFPDLNPQRRPGVIVSEDQGKTWQWRGGPFVEHRAFDEPMVVEKKDGTWWMLIRTKHGISESFSMDQGYSWSQARPSIFAGPSSRFHFTRLSSGRLLLINHLGSPGNQRTHLTAMLSDDDGQTWPHRLLLDERNKVSYPDATHTPDGRIWIVYDRERFDAREILLAAITENDILAGKPASDSRLKVVISKATGPKPA